MQPPLTQRITDHLSAPISIQSLAVTRILFGLILLYDCYRYFKYDRITRYYVEAEFNFPYFGLDFIQPLPEPWIYVAWALTGVLAFMVMIGLFYRASIIGFTLVFTYFFLLDRTQYLNHNYMILLYSVLLCFAPAAKAYSIDAWRNPAWRSVVIPRWPVTAIKLQTEIILIYAGVVKITDDWLRGEPLRMWLQARVDEVALGFMFHYEWVVLAGAWGTVALHILGAPLLLWRRTRLTVFIIYVLFHLSNKALFNIGIFPWITIAVTLIFFAPDWPQRLARRVLGVFETLPPMPAAPQMAVPRIATPLLVILTVWFAVQVVIPQRQIIFPNHVGWTGDGHRFSWRMRIYNRAAEGEFRVVDQQTGEAWTVDPRDLMSRRQARVVMTRTDLIHDFAQRLEAMALADGHADVAVYADIRKSLNGRPMQPYTDPSVDLTAAAYPQFRPVDWIYPLQTRAATDVMPEWWPPLPLQRPDPEASLALPSADPEPVQAEPTVIIRDLTDETLSSSSSP